MNAPGLSRRQRLGGGLVIALLALWIGAAAAVRLQAWIDPVPARTPPPIPVELAELASETFEISRSYRGSVEAEHRAQIAARIGGEILELPHREGAAVERGAVLFRLDDEEPRRELERIEASLERLESELALARRELDRQQRLYARELTAERQLDDAAQRTQALEAQLRESRASRALLETRLAYTVGRAPFSGRIQRLHLREGDLAAAGAPVVELVGAGALKAVLSVPQRDVARIHQGQPVHLEVPALGRGWAGRIDRLHPALEPATRSATIAAFFPPPAEALVRAGMAVRGQVALEAYADAIVVPADAVHGETERWVFLLENGRAQRREVRVGSGRDGRLPVLEGLEAGERLIVTGDPRLADGAAVRVATAPGRR